MPLVKAPLLAHIDNRDLAARLIPASQFRWRDTSGHPCPPVGVDDPRRHQGCQNEVAVDLRQRRPSVEQISRIGMDTSKHIFQLHGVNTAEEPVLRKKLRRREMFAFLEKLAPTVIAIEACGASHHCARLLQSFGHSVKLIAPQLVKPYIVKTIGYAFPVPGIPGRYRHVIPYSSITPPFSPSYPHSLHNPAPRHASY